MRELDEITAKLFQHTAARRRLDAPCFTDNNGFIVSTHSRPKAAGKIKTLRHLYASVSTHSRPKAAGATVKANCRSWVRFNTQPPEGGWIDRAQQRRNRQRVSTHSRPKAAGQT